MGGVGWGGERPPRPLGRGGGAAPPPASRRRKARLHGYRRPEPRPLASWGAMCGRRGGWVGACPAVPTRPRAPKRWANPPTKKEKGAPRPPREKKKRASAKLLSIPPPPPLHPLPPFTLTGNDAPRRSHEGRRVGRPVGERGGGRAQAARAPAAAAHCLDVPPLSRRRGAGGGRRAARRPGLGRGGRGPGERGGPRAAIPGQAGRGGRGEGGGAAQRRRGQRDNRAA